MPEIQILAIDLAKRSFQVCATDRAGSVLLARRPRMVAAAALANKMARIIWAMMTREENYPLA